MGLWIKATLKDADSLGFIKNIELIIVPRIDEIIVVKNTPYKVIQVYYGTNDLALMTLDSFSNIVITVKEANFEIPRGLMYVK
jgi:hypothetical protein